MNSDNMHLLVQLIPLQLWNTIYMVVVATFFATLIGLPLGVVLMITGKGQIKEHPKLYKVLETVVNIGRSFPYAILMVALIPFTRLIVGTSLGTEASIVPLTIAAIPFLARLIETNLREVDSHVVEAAVVMGSSTWQIVTKVLLCEALPAMVASVTLTMINLIGYSAMAGLVGGGGLGQVAVQYGYNQFNTFIMVVTIVILIALVQIVQGVGGYIGRAIAIKRGRLLRE